MEVKIMSRVQAVRYSYVSSKNAIYVSISDLAQEKPKFCASSCIKDIIYLQFDDVDFGSNCITPEIGKNIADFINKWKADEWREDEYKLEEIIVHCHAGISRSSGVAAAISKYLNDSDYAIFHNKKYSVNMKCYRTVLNAFYE